MTERMETYEYELEFVDPEDDFSMQWIGTEYVLEEQESEYSLEFVE